MDNWWGIDYREYGDSAVSKKTVDFDFDEEVDKFNPTERLLRSMLKAIKSRSEGKVSPIFSTTDEMKKWVDAQDA